MADVLLKGTSASNHKIIDSGYSFKYAALAAALKSALSS
jgi:NAD dependent epimerase/dehydratase family enzyme